MNLDYFPNPRETTLRYWTSGWGQEWEPQVFQCLGKIIICAESGRSSEQFHPFFVLSDKDSSFALAIPWSGNWSFELIPTNDHVEIIISADIEDLLPIYAHISGGDWQEATAALRREYFSTVKKSSVPAMKTEWNHWWPYEASGIDEAIFLANAQVASECGIEVAVLDAGWFGESTSGDWEGFRGDWEVVNSTKFPNGLSELANETRNLGIEFGIWIEIETIGRSSKVFNRFPEYLALRDGEYLGYACFGSSEVVEWALGIVRKLVQDTKATWIKFDFNISPKAGCNRGDHGHDVSAGLAAHVTALYAFFQQLKLDFPQVVLENCSSGGMRWDYGVAPYFDFGFSSDKDWPDHALSVFWASAHFFPVQKLLGWCDSEWLNLQPHQDFKIASASDDHLHYALSIAMLGGFGLSQRLSDFSSTQRELLKAYSELYKERFRPRYQAGAEIRFLTDQPLRDGRGGRTVAFAIEMATLSTILAVYQLTGCVAGTVRYPFQSESKSVGATNLVTGERSEFTANNGYITIPTTDCPYVSLLYILDN